MPFVQQRFSCTAVEVSIWISNYTTVKQWHGPIYVRGHVGPWIKKNTPHYSDVTMSAMASKITGVSIVCPPFVHVQIKGIPKGPRHWPLWGEFTGDCGRFPSQKASNAENATIWWRHHYIPSLRPWTVATIANILIRMGRHYPSISLLQLPLKLRHGQVKASNIKQWMQLLITVLMSFNLF